MELVQVGEKTYYLKNHTNIGIYQIDANNIYLIDTGNDKDCGKKILKIVEEKNWHVKGIITTHSHADHIGGNAIIQEKTGCKIYAMGIEKDITEHPILEPSFLYGGYPFNDLKNKFLYAKESKVTVLDHNLPEGLEYFSLKGHSLDMIGIKTSDQVYFLADSLISMDTILKYHVFFLYDVSEYLHTLEWLKTLDGKYYIPSHSELTDDISSLIDANQKKIFEIADTIVECCQKASTFDEILKFIFERYHLIMNINQYLIIGSTIKSYLSYLYEQEKISYEFIDNQMKWKSK